MALTLAGIRLTEAHRLAQVGLGARVSNELLLLWSLVDPNRLAQTTPEWMTAALALMQVRRIDSANLAASYLQLFRTIEAPQLQPVAPVLMAGLDVRAAATSLDVVGPGSIRRAMTAGTDLTSASETAGTNTARAAMRHVLNGGRDTITATVAADTQITGFRRVTSGNACKFCLMLAGRGAVYSADTARFASHDGCSCSAEPAYDN